MTEITKKAIYNICVNNKDLLLVDCLNHLHRYAWVNQELSVTIGDEVKLTGHLYGFMSFIVSLKNRFPNCSIVLALDGEDKERRLYDRGYKAQREHTYKPDEDMQEILDMCSVFPDIYACYDEDREADDVIYSVSKKVKELCDKKGIDKQIYILSNDKDMYQCVSDNSKPCKINIIRKFGVGSKWLADADIVDYEAVQSKFNGVRPENLVKFRAIVGDSSDNLKGYYRFMKKNASIIAENFSVTDSGLELNEGITYDPKWDKFLDVIRKDYHIFYKNYQIMKLKDFNFELTPLVMTDVDKVTGIISKYQLEKFKAEVYRYSPYRNEILQSFSRRG